MILKIGTKYTFSDGLVMIYGGTRRAHGSEFHVFYEKSSPQFLAWFTEKELLEQPPKETPDLGRRILKIVLLEFRPDLFAESRKKK